MPQRSAVSLLPDDVREALERRLMEGGFSDYQGLSDWLTEQGFEISRSSVHRFGQKYEERLSKLKLATDQAKLMAKTVGDDEGAMNEALIRRYQAQIWELMDKLEDMNIDPRTINFSRLGETIARLGHASISQKKWAEQVQKRVAAVLDAAEAKSGGASGAATIDSLRAAIMAEIA